MTKSCSNCHYHQASRCTEPRNQNVATSLAAGGTYEVRLEPPIIDLDGVCDFHHAPMRNNYRRQETKP